MKTTFSHDTGINGIATRTSAHTYTHVLLVTDTDAQNVDQAAEYAYLADQPERMKSAIAYAEDQAARWANPVVYSWHKSEANAVKAAATLMNRGGGWTSIKVEAINGGAA